MIGELALLAMLATTPATGSGAAIGAAIGAEGGPALVFEQYGGITGWVTRLTIRSDGSATVVDRSGGRHRFALTTSEQARVDRRLAAADLPELAGRYTTAGAAYLFVYRIASGRAQVVADQLALPPQAQPLVRTLSRLLTSALAGDR